MRSKLFTPTIIAVSLSWIVANLAIGADDGLVGHWKLQGDCRDYSGHGNHGINHGVNLETGTFNGSSAYIEVADSDSLQFGTNDFTFCAWIFTPAQLDDIVGDLFEKYDPQKRRGITLSISSSAGGYQSQGTDRHVHFGIDNARVSQWQDCGRPNPQSNYVSNSLTVYRGQLYAATADARNEENWGHVYRYEGGRRWIDCGRVGDDRTSGVGPLIVHEGKLYAVTSTYDWTRVKNGGYDPGRVYEYLGGTRWQDCGQPGEIRTANCVASFQGKLYVGGGPQPLGVFVRGDGDQWSPSILFSMEGPRSCFPHAMCRHNGRLYVAFPGAYSFDGQKWTFAGNPLPLEKNPFLQTHSLEIYQGKLCAGTWPEAKVAVYQGREDWREIGRVGIDGTEVNSLAVYNGKLYGGSLPRGEVCRLDGTSEWTSIKRFYSPEGWQPGLPGKASREQVNEWTRVTSLTVFNGRLFASIGSCTSSVLDAPIDVRGKVASMEAGKVASYQDDLAPGWRHIAAIREGAFLKLYIDGRLMVKSCPFDAAEYDLSNDQPLRLGAGQTDYLDGKLADVMLYNRALCARQVFELTNQRPQ